MKTEIFAIIEKYGYLKTPQFWITIKKQDAEGSSRIGPFKSLKQCGIHLKTHSPDMPVYFKHYLGWDQNETMIMTTTESYNAKAFGNYYGK
jgi:hypothetical protein